MQGRIRGTVKGSSQVVLGKAGFTVIDRGGYSHVGVIGGTYGR